MTDGSIRLQGEEETPAFDGLPQALHLGDIFPPSVCLNESQYCSIPNTHVACLVVKSSLRPQRFRVGHSNPSLTNSSLATPGKLPELQKD